MRDTTLNTTAAFAFAAILAAGAMGAPPSAYAYQTAPACSTTVRNCDGSLPGIIRDLFLPSDPGPVETR